MLNLHLLSGLIGISLIGSLLVAITHNPQSPNRGSYLGLFVSLVCLILGGTLLSQFDPTQHGLQFQESYLWIQQWNIRYAVGVDGLSLLFIILTISMTTLVILNASANSYPRSAQSISQFLLIQALVIGSFAATDAMFFYICWEALLLPILMNIGMLGSQKRAYASIKFFLYTFLGSTALLIAFLYLGQNGSTLNFTIHHLYPLALTQTEQRLLFVAFFIAFTIKVPLWPLHTWLPDAHTEAPTEGSVLLSGLMLKLGGYGLLRFCLPIVPDASQEFAFIVCILSLIAIIYAGLITLVQTDMKRLLAYSSISHMGLVVLGIFVILLPSSTSTAHNLNLLSLEGAVVQMIAHALSTGGLFFCIGLLYQRFHTRNIASYHGITTMMPFLGRYAFLFILATLGLPGTSGFVGEFLIIIGSLHAKLWIGAIAAVTLLLSATYSLWFYTRIFWGELHYPPQENKVPLSFVEKLPLYLLASLILLIGIFPQVLIYFLESTLENLLSLSLQSKL